MNVVRAEEMGMCFGVRDALKVIGAVEAPREVTIHGELVHNEVVLARLEAGGFGMTGESDRREVPATPTVLITAHGVSDRERARLSAAGKTLIDTTCPLVARAHEAAQRLKREGCFVVVVGRRGHVEVRGVVEDLDDFTVVESPEEVRPYPASRIGIVCQTTAAPGLVREVREAVARENPGAEVRFIDTVCLPTKERQRSLDRLIDRVDAVVVVGGRNSNNTKELVALCSQRGKPALHVQSAGDLDPSWFHGFRTVGLTAGTSTLGETIEEVYEALVRLPEAGDRWPVAGEEKGQGLQIPDSGVQRV
jgi:4-hydroxy-3-methylbut-2-enyl diphosphate reductase